MNPRNSQINKRLECHDFPSCDIEFICSNICMNIIKWPIASYQSSRVCPGLGCLKLCLQMRRGVEISALFTRTTAFHEIHTDRNDAISCIHLYVIGRMCETAVRFCSLTIASLEFTADLTKSQIVFKLMHCLCSI